MTYNHIRPDSIEPFKPKTLFLVDDKEEYRTPLLSALLEAGHSVPNVATSYNEAVHQIPFVLGSKTEITLLPCCIPYHDEGIDLIRTILVVNPRMLFVGISDWKGSWEDPLYDGNNLHPSNINRYDINGRSSIKSTDYHFGWVKWNPKDLAQVIGRMEFSMQEPEGMRSLKEYERMNEAWLASRQARK